MRGAARLGLLVVGLAVGLVVALVVGAVWFAGRTPETAESATAQARQRASERTLEAAPMELARETTTQLTAQPDELPSGHALLRLRVIGHEGGAPVEGSEWRLVMSTTQPKTHAELAEATRGFDPSAARTDAANRAELVARTDAEGRAQFVAPANVELKLVCGPPDDVEQLVPPLAEREVRELTLRVGPTADDWFVARVVDAQTKQPIEGVEFLPLSRFAADLDTLEVGARSDSNGEVHIDMRTWSPFDALVRARGYGLRAIPVRVDRSRPRVELELVRGGPLEVRIDGSKGLRKDMQVDVTFARGALYVGATTGKAEQRMLATLPLDEELRTELASPPLGAEIEVLARVRPHAPASQTVTLAPGAARAAQFDFRRNSAIVGTVHTDDPAAAAGVILVLRRAGDAPHAASSASHQAPELGEQPIAALDLEPRVTTTDESGAFRFDGVPPGDWSIGTDPERVHALALAGDPTVVRTDVRATSVLGDGVEHSLQLYASVGWMIVGRVIDADGAPVTEGNVKRLNVLTRRTLETALIDAEGSFTFGPLPEGPVWAAAYASMAPATTERTSDYTEAAITALKEQRSHAILVEGPTSDVVLRLARSGRICGYPTAADGRFAESVVFYLDSESEFRVAAVGSKRGPHRFCFEALPPGQYRVVAQERAGGKRMGVSRPIDLAEGENVDGVTIELTPPASVSLSADVPLAPSDPGHVYQIDVDGAYFGQLRRPSVESEAPGRTSSSGDPPLRPRSIDAPAGHARVWAIASSPSVPEDKRMRLFAEFELAPGEQRVIEVPR